MTRDQNYHSPVDEEELDLSPTDGYFGSNNSVPDTVLVPDATHTPATPEGSAKADEVKGSTGKKNTTYTPATTSRADSDSAYNGSTGRYHDDPNERSPLLEGPPPMYEEAMSNSAHSTSSPAPQQSTNFSRPRVEPQQPTTNGTKPPPYDDHVQREIRHHEISHSISGSYKLYDLLDLSTVSGSINVNVVPQYGDKPAVLRIGSVSGSVRVSIDDTWTQVSQSRVFETYIHTTSGSILGSIIQSGGGNTDVHSTSGKIRLNLLPVNLDDGGNESHISTRELSGSTKIVLESPLDRSRITKLFASYQCSGSGSIDVSHPVAWEGKVHARSIGSGSVNLVGSLDDIVQHGKKDVEGSRGHGSALVSIKTLGSGSVKFTC